jgi:alkylation response protein AidB-like acyl-CoA dehydrogenase
VDFDFSDEQYLLRDALRDLLTRECTPQHVRAMWDDPTGRSPQRWRRLAEMGVLGLCVPESAGGFGGDEVDMVLLLEEAGRHVLPEPLLEHAALAAPLLARAGSSAQQSQWLSRLAAGDAIATVGLSAQRYVPDAGTADVVVMEAGGDLHLLTPDRLTLEPVRSVDGARRLFRVTAETGPDTLLPGGREALPWLTDHAAAGTSAVLLGIAGALLDRTLAYVKVREQFGKRIGTFQAVQHKLAETWVLLEMARGAVYYAAYALANELSDAAVAVSVAKAAAGDAEHRANQEALQLHGGIGFTWEHDLHLWLKRGKALEPAYGDADHHRRRIADHIYATAG